MDMYSDAPVKSIPRQEKLLALLEKTGYQSTVRLAELLGVSEQTIRRDVRQLENLNLIKRYHGGVTAIKSSSMVNKAIHEREISFVSEKGSIAEAVANLIPDHSTIFITIGTTVEKIASVLCKKSGLVVITDSLRVANILYSSDNSVLLPSGTVKASNGGISGPKTLNDLEIFKADFAITSVGCIDSDGTLLDYNLSEVEAAKIMINNSRQLMLCCDHSKFASSAPVKLGHVTDASYLITDSRPPEGVQRMLDRSNTKLVVTNEN